MTELNQETLKYLERLCRIRCTPEEESAILRDLDNVLEYVKKLQELDTDNIPPCKHVLEDIFHYLRDDEIGDVTTREEFLNNAPDKIGGMIRVPPIIRKNEST